LPFLVFIATPAGAACQLDGDDFAALRLSPSGIQDQQAGDKLPNEQQIGLCNTRAVIRKIRDAHNVWVGNAAPDYWPYFLAPDEKTIAIKAANAWLIKRLPK